jgi:hypothetical protein
VTCSIDSETAAAIASARHAERAEVATVIAGAVDALNE